LVERLGNTGCDRTQGLFELGSYCTLEVVTGNFTTISVCPGSLVKRIPEARTLYEKALALARQEPERRFRARRLQELK
jgi:predicted RNA polymerase sigma factor